jgi:hypothetical protein
MLSRRKLSASCPIAVQQPVDQDFEGLTFRIVQHFVSICAWNKVGARNSSAQAVPTVNPKRLSITGESVDNHRDG